MDSALRSIEALKQSDWDRIMLELQLNLLTLIQLLECLVPSPSENKSLLFLIASQLLKARHGRLGLVQGQCQSCSMAMTLINKELGAILYGLKEIYGMPTVVGTLLVIMSDCCHQSLNPSLDCLAIPKLRTLA